MRAIRFGLRTLLREARAGELAVLLAALTIAVGSVTAVGFLTDRIGQAVALQAAEVLAADLRLRSSRPLDPARLDAARAAGLRTARTLTFPSVVFAGDDSALATIKAVTDGYPLRGETRIASELFATPTAAQGVPGPGQVWLDNALMARLAVNVGDVIELGAAEFEIAAVVTYRPDQTPGFAGLAPTLLINLDDIAATGLIQEGSRVSYAQLFAGPRGAIQAFTRSVADAAPDDVRVEDRGDAGRELNEAIARASRFLALASLVSLLLAAVAVAMAARRYAERRLDAVAMMKSIGATQRFILISSLVQLVVIGVVASLIGAAVGLAAERLLSNLLAGLLRGELPGPSLRPMILGFGTAMILLAGFALPSLQRLGNTPPLRVLRRDLAPPPPGTLVTYGFAVAALGVLVYWSVRDLTLLAVIVGGTAATGLVLYATGRGLVGLIGRGRRGVGVAWRYGLANVARRGQESAVQIVAFGLGLMVLLVLTLVRNDLLAGWRATLDEDAPNQFLINIQPDERAGVAAILRDAGLGAVDFVPLVRARMTAVNRVGVGDRRYPQQRGRRLANRNANLTYLAQMPASNALVAGEWWPDGYSGPALVSVEEDAARSMDIRLGDALEFTVAGEQLNATVSSLRRVDWDSFQPNFFMVLSPNSVLDYPQTFVTSLKVPEDKRAALRALVRAHPSVSVIDIEAVLDQVRQVIDKAAVAVQSVFLFTLAAGLVVLFAAVQATLDERRYESALLRTFGARRGTVFAGLAAEFVALGLAAGVFAALGASLVGGLAARQLFELEYSIDPTLWLIGIVAGVAVVGASGVLAARSAVNTPPVNTLRRI